MILYYLSAAQLVAEGKPLEWWKTQGLTPLVGLDPDWFYAPRKTLDFGRIGAALAGAEWYASLWTTNNTRGSLLQPLDDDAAWADLCERLRSWPNVTGLRGFLLDLEYYPATPGGAAGPMAPAKAGPWAKASPQLRARADQLAAALSPLTLGGTITTTEIARLPGLAQWLRRMSKHGKCWVLSEDFNGASDRGAVADVGAHYLPGFATVAAARQAGGPAWVYDPHLKALG